MTRISRSRMDMEGARVDNAFLKDYGEAVVGGASGASTGSTYTIDLSQGNVFNLVLSANCTFTFSNAPASGTNGSFTLILHQDATGGRTVTWPATAIWPGGTAPTLTSDANTFDLLNFVTYDGGSSWFGFLAAYHLQIP